MNWQRLIVPAALLLLTACANQPNQPAPIVDRYQQGSTAPTPAPTAPAGNHGPIVASGATGDTYVVQKGDGLYRIAMDHGVAYRDLAAWNNLDDVNSIKVGQVLRLTAPGSTPAAAADAGGVEVRPLKDAAPAATAATPATAPVVAANKSYPKAMKLPYSAQNASGIAALAEGPAVVSKPQQDIARPAKAATASEMAATADAVTKSNDKSASQPVSEAASAAASEVDWMWPTTGQPTKPFTDESRGIDIVGKMGQSVIASASGKVVYAGSGLRGYGKMIIIKHSNEFLSAYAHNSKLLVKEGDIVKKGEKIAEMGNTDADQVKLHFEIRRFGKPVDPAKYIHSDKS
ncbi:MULTISPECIES: peptidoglycan DD-metalloendopeptidase family protein [Silvimonas]|uniref:peptidoglycan DD-metalloendopeptidase family protein n=1 Tax=Silvimonas TaxID=300264 RepID=UPI0024B34E4A|nr:MULTISPECIES: peptidoglycan DD-metalloendopeptidase family protein [Silvimonas]MDR3428702.1 peptidoglycan DD-metalloendopeptidase family protein [Silvimonas sp.]